MKLNLRNRQIYEAFTLTIKREHSSFIINYRMSFALFVVKKVAKKEKGLGRNLSPFLIRTL